MSKRKNAFLIVLLIYIICFVFRAFEYFVLRTDRTVFGEAFVHKLIGIAILFIAARMLSLKLSDIGFKKERIASNLLKGLAFGLSVFILAYALEMLLISLQGKSPFLDVYVSAYAVDKNIGNRTAVMFYIICIVGNIINVLMEEGIFRGLFVGILRGKHSFIKTALITSALFGLWHIISPLRSYADADISLYGFIANALMLVITSGLVGFKFAMLTRITGSLYFAMGDHFVNNTIVNILHVVSDTGADEMMFVRITAAQSISFAVVLIAYLKKRRELPKYA